MVFFENNTEAQEGNPVPKKLQESSTGKNGTVLN